MSEYHGDHAGEVGQANDHLLITGGGRGSVKLTSFFITVYIWTASRMSNRECGSVVLQMIIVRERCATLFRPDCGSRFWYLCRQPIQSNCAWEKEKALTGFLQ